MSAILEPHEITQTLRVEDDKTVAVSKYADEELSSNKGEDDNNKKA